MRQPLPQRRPVALSFRLAAQFFVNHGPVRGLRLLFRRLRRRRTAHLASAFDLFPRQIPASTHPFDLLYRVDTSGFHHGEDLGPAPVAPHTTSPDVDRESKHLLPSTLWNTAYYGIAPSLFDRALALIGLPPGSPGKDVFTGPEQHPVPLDPEWSRFSFVDLGCGKGRALLLASRYPFRAILGVELDPVLAATAQANLCAFQAPWQQCHRLTALHGDATAIDLPESPLLLYLYHPFLAPALKRVLRRLERSLRQRPRELWLVYINPEAAHVLRSFPLLREHTRTTLTIAAEDALPDRLGSSQEEVAIYHFLPPA